MEHRKLIAYIIIILISLGCSSNMNGKNDFFLDDSCEKLCDCLTNNLRPYRLSIIEEMDARVKREGKIKPSNIWNIDDLLIITDSTVMNSYSQGSHDFYSFYQPLKIQRCFLDSSCILEVEREELYGFLFSLSNSATDKSHLSKMFDWLKLKQGASCEAKTIFFYLMYSHRLAIRDSMVNAKLKPGPLKDDKSVFQKILESE
jgi:hypothetical protein